MNIKLKKFGFLSLLLTMTVFLGLPTRTLHSAPVPYGTPLNSLVVRVNYDWRGISPQGSIQVRLGPKPDGTYLVQTADTAGLVNFEVFGLTGKYTVEALVFFPSVPNMASLPVAEGKTVVNLPMPIGSVVTVEVADLPPQHGSD